MSRAVRIFALLTALTAFTGCVPNSYLAKTGNPELPPIPRKIVLIPAEVNVIEISAGGVPEEVEEWSQQASKNLVDAVHREARSGARFEILALPDLNPWEQDILKTHLAMYELVIASVNEYGLSTDSVWRERAPQLHYTVGPGLSFLQEKTGATAAMFIVGEDSVLTGGRLLLMAATVLAFGFPAVPPSHSYFAAGVVDLATGDLLWHNFDWNIARRDLRKPEDANGLVAEVLAAFPVNPSQSRP